MVCNYKNMHDVFAVMGVDACDTPKYINLLRASVGLDPLTQALVAASWFKLNDMAQARGVYNQYNALRMRQILLGVLCLRWTWDESFVYLNCRRHLLTADFFELFTDPDNHAAAVPGLRIDAGRCEDTAVFIQSFYNLIADTGHVITPEHMQMAGEAFDLINAADDNIIAIQEAFRMPRRFRWFNRRAVKKAGARLAELWPGYGFRVFQQDYDADGFLAYNATLYCDFSTPGYGFVLDCRLETDLAAQTADVSVVLFSRLDKERFAAEFAHHGFLARLGFVFNANTPNGPCWVRRRAVGLNAADAEGVTSAVVDEVVAVMAELPL